MSKIDLKDHEWTELVFVGKNKEYGAYELRNDSTKRHNRSMLFVAIFAIVAFSLPKLIQMVKPNFKDKNVEVTTLSTIKKAAEVKQDLKKPVSVEPPPAVKSSIKFTVPKIAKDEEVNDDEQIKTQEQLNQSTQAISIADVVGNDEKGQDIQDVKVAVTQVEDEKPFDVVEQMPQFPGGEDDLIAYIGKNLRYPVIAQENGIQGRVVIRFVVSRTGEVEKAEVVRSLDSNCDKEALRVVRSLPKWIPGRQNGENVPVYYTLPITFRLQ